VYILVFLGLSVLDLDPMNVTDVRQTSDGGIINDIYTIYK